MSQSPSSPVFGSTYASAYEALYRDKDYTAECDFLEQCFRAVGVAPKSILELGAGSGGHAMVLARRGYRLTGVDRSPDMLSIARGKAGEAGLDLDLREGDIRSFSIPGTFDAVISMFAVMSYQTENADLAAACATAYKHLRPGGVFVFDGWHGPGVFSDRPTSRIKTVTDGQRRIVRFTTPLLDTVRSTVETRFTLWTVEDGRISEEVEESHTMRFLFPMEIAYFLTVAGFRDVQFCPFMRLGEPLTLNDWQMAVIAIR